jgi:small subunit ribosomal protein S1
MSLSIKALEEYPGENVEKLDQVMANAEERWEKAQTASVQNKTNTAPESSSLE